MKKMLLSILVIALSSLTASGSELSVVLDKNLAPKEKIILKAVLKEVISLLPEKMKKGLPNQIKIKTGKLSDHLVIPNEICENGKKVSKKNSRPFVYGSYQKISNTLIINRPLLNELAKGKNRAVIIDCQHKSLYDQAIATIIHELTHAYDLKNHRLSHSAEYIRRAGFKRGLLKVKNKNIDAMRSMDSYELKNIYESFAVNMEYFTMDPEFYCRRPSIFNFYKKHFEVDPFPTRTCKVNNTIMVSGQAGYTPTELDSKRVYRIDYLIAAPGKEAASGFGHSMFRIVVCAPERLDPISNTIIPATPYGKKCLEDKLFHLVISFRANVEDAKLNYLKGLGLWGAYPSMLFILNFSDVLDEYTRDELRDIVAYPLRLSAQEKEEFILKTKEDHWNYRGAYKFITGNCATESYDLLKSALPDIRLNSKSSLSPQGVLEDLDKLEYLSLKDDSIEVYPAQTEQLVAAYKKIKNISKIEGKNEVKVILKYVEQSSIESRMQVFNRFKSQDQIRGDLNTELTFLKERMMRASSFSVMEQHIQRVLALATRKKAAEVFMNTKDERIKKLIKESGNILKKNFDELTLKGYGIPFKEELVSEDKLKEEAGQGAELLSQAEKYLNEILPDEMAKLEKISDNIIIYNQFSLNLRKEFRAKLDQYVNQVLKNLARNEQTRPILQRALEGNSDELKRVRKFLGEDLVSEREILDGKLKKIIREILS